ncbi:hypothetical protein [Aridibaculum aurantiacum]|uniref:hypothetical protein n=1 Tax=Aridibaculum aurantiacum TaxID=2810307 RepID=UPI001A95928C|nr:hypothetical protein [Aridibaculum aurantiacum]
MNEIVERVAAQAGISPEQAQKAVEAIAGFVKEKFPMLEGAVENMFKSGGGNDTGGTGLGNLGGFGGFGQK